MHEQLFELNYALCKEFPALSPYGVDMTPYAEVISMYADVMRVHIRRSGDKDVRGAAKTIRRPAGDNWF